MAGYKKCQPVWGSCKRKEGHTGSHSQLTEAQFQKEARQKSSISAAQREQYCRFPLHKRAGLHVKGDLVE